MKTPLVKYKVLEGLAAGRTIEAATVEQANLVLAQLELQLSQPAQLSSKLQKL